MSQGLQLLLLIVLMMIIGLAVLVATNRIIFKMAVRNFARRKAQSAIVIAGLMVGTAIISSSLVIGDTMSNIFEHGTYKSLGELDEEVWGLSQFGGVQYFNESVYYSMSENLSATEGIESVVPVIGELCSVRSYASGLGEPSISLRGLDSEKMRNSSFGDLDGGGFYTDALAPGEVAINSRLARSIEVAVGDVIEISYGARNLTSVYVMDYLRENFTVAKVIDETELYGKANHNGRASVFVELDTAQEMFRREGEITAVWISNLGDYRGGEQHSKLVEQDIKTALNESLGMSDLGISIDDDGISLTMWSKWGYFPLDYSEPMVREASGHNASVLEGVMVPSISLNGAPTGGMMVMGYDTEDPIVPALEEGKYYTFQPLAQASGIQNGSSVRLTTMGLDGQPRETSLTAEYLPAYMQAILPEEIRNATMGFVEMETAQTLLHGGHFESRMASFVRVFGVNKTVREDIAAAAEAELDEQTSADDLNLMVSLVKYDNLKAGREGGEAIGAIFLVFSVFAIIAGIVLIVNIFVMLAEERKGEMGIARAVGMKRKHLVRMFLFEGTLYAFAASAFGSFVGLGIGRILIYSFSFVFSAPGEEFVFPFYFEWESILLAFCLGLILTFITIFGASRRASRLNIIRAIRRIPEPRGERAETKDLVLGAAMSVFGILFIAYAAANDHGASWLAGPTLVFLGLAVIAYRWLPIRGTITAGGLATIAWIFNPYPLPFVQMEDSTGMNMFISSGVCLVLAGTLVVLFNSQIFVSLMQKTVGRRKANRAVMKTAIAYPMSSKFKTGMTLGMFALIIFTVTVVAMIAAMQQDSVDTFLREQSGGYDIVGYTNPRTPFENLTMNELPASVADDVERLDTISSARVSLEHYDRVEGTQSDYAVVMGASDMGITSLMGVNKEFVENNGFELAERDGNYSSDREAWRALELNSSLCILDGSRFEMTGISFGSTPSGAYVGGSVVVKDLQGQNLTKEFKVVGIMKQQFFVSGVFVNDGFVENVYGGTDSVLLVKNSAGADDANVARELEKGFGDRGLNTVDIEAEVDASMASATNVLYLMEGFLAIGLLIGIAGIGIVSYRNVLERRQQIGMLRAIGFRRRMISRSFLIETSFITIIATLMGMLMGIGIGYQIWISEGGFKEMGAGFVVPWGNLVVIAVVSYAATLLFTFYPAVMASRIPPAEALRYIE